MFSSCYQFICNIVHDVRIIKPSSLVLPPAFDENTGLPLEIGQVEIISETTRIKKLSWTSTHTDKDECSGFDELSDLSVMTGFIGGVVETDVMSPSVSISSSLEP